MPSAARIEAAAAWLLAKGDRRGVVQLVSRWAEVADLTPKARLTAAEAFLALGQADRAWAALRELVDPVMSDANAVPVAGQYEALRLAARLFAERGWLAKARRPLELAALVAPSPEVAAQLRAEVAALDTPTEPLPDDPPGADDPKAMLALAQRHLLAGAQIKARRLIERARRADPSDALAEELLWGLAGDYSAGTATLAELVDRAVPDFGGGLSLPVDVTEETDDRTEEADLGEAQTPDDKQRPFPTLFRGADGSAEGHEGTASMRMEDLPKLEPMAEPPTDVPLGGDTQIARVIRHGEGVELEPTTGPLHTGGVEDVAKGFDLAAFRREMGMDVATDLPNNDYDSGFEDEDISRVVRVVREAPTEITDTTTGGFLEQLEPDTSGDAHRAAPGPEAKTPPPQGERAAPPAAPAEAAVNRSGETPAGVRRRVTEPGRRKKPAVPPTLQWYLLVIGLVLLFGATVVFLLVLVTFLKG